MTLNETTSAGNPRKWPSSAKVGIHELSISSNNHPAVACRSDREVRISKSRVRQTSYQYARPKGRATLAPATDLLALNLVQGLNFTGNGFGSLRLRLLGVAVDRSRELYCGRTCPSPYRCSCCYSTCYCFCGFSLHTSSQNKFDHQPHR